MSGAHYLLQVNIYLIVFYGFYRLLLDRETYFHFNRTYLIAAGPPADEGSFALFTWSGRAADKPVLLLQEELGQVRPEALFAIPGTSDLQILSDDGGEHVKTLAEEKQEFRSVTITLADGALQPQR